MYIVTHMLSFSINRHTDRPNYSNPCTLSINNNSVTYTLIGECFLIALAIRKTYETKTVQAIGIQYCKKTTCL